MRSRRLSRLLLGFTLLAWIGTRAAPGSKLDTEQMASKNSPGLSCSAVNGVSWTLFREKCYHVSKSVGLSVQRKRFSVTMPRSALKARRRRTPKSTIRHGSKREKNARSSEPIWRPYMTRPHRRNSWVSAIVCQLQCCMLIGTGT